MSLDYTGWGSTGDRLSIAADLIKGASNLQNLTVKHEVCNTRSWMIDEWLSCSPQNVPRMRKLKSLVLEGVRDWENMYIDFLQNQPNLQQLVLKNTTIEHRGGHLSETACLVRFLGALRNLRILDISVSGSLTDRRGQIWQIADDGDISIHESSLKTKTMDWLLQPGTDEPCPIEVGWGGPYSHAQNPEQTFREGGDPSWRVLPASGR